MIIDVFENGGSSLVDFDAENALEKWKPINGGDVSLSNEHVKFGEKALKWSYEKDSMLRMTGCEPLAKLNKNPASQGIKLWIYNDKKMDSDLIVKIGKSSFVTVAPTYRFKVHLDFTGWRAVWIRVNVSARTFIVTTMFEELDAIEFEAPDADEGVLYFDAFEVLDSLSSLLGSDFQVPYLPMWTNSYQYETYKRIPDTDGGEICTQEHKNAFQTICERLDNYIIPMDVDYDALSDKDPLKIRYNGLKELVDEQIRIYDSYKIHRADDGCVCGPGLFAASEDNKKHKFSNFEKIWVSLALDYKLYKNKDSKRKILELFDHFYEQGWAEGSFCGSFLFDEIRVDGYAHALFMLRDELKESGIYQRELDTFRWRSEFGYVFSYADEDIAAMVPMHCDKMRSLVFFQLMYILQMEDTPLKVSYMKQYIKYLCETIIVPKNGIDHGIKMDYTLWHHHGTYMTAYGSEAINALCLIRYLLHGTCFELEKECVETLNNILKVYVVSSVESDLPATRVCGRFPHHRGTLLNILTAFATMAASGDDTMTSIFSELIEKNEARLAKFYEGKLPLISWMETPGQLQLFKEVTAKQSENGKRNDDGIYIFPYGGYCVFRQKDWLLSISGWSCYIWDFETGISQTISQNRYGRYLNYGSTILACCDERVITDKGLDWNNIPGTTAKYLPYDMLISDWWTASRYYSDKSFLGGVKSDKNCGIYALSFHDTNFDTSFKGKKSWFLLGDKIVCLGTGIENDDCENRTQTTLFQYPIEKDSIVKINGRALPDYEFNGEEGECVTVKDVYGNGYIVPNGNGFVLNKNKQSLIVDNGIATGNESVVAYIDHGLKPSAAEYEYVIFPKCTDKALENASENLNYSIVEKSTEAHIVKSGCYTGYVIFDKEVVCDGGALKSADTPCIVMEKRLSDEKCLLTVTDPDLHIGDFPDKADKKHIMRITLYGEWEILNKSLKADYKNGETIILLECSDGEQTDVEMVLRG